MTIGNMVRPRRFRRADLRRVRLRARLPFPHVRARRPSNLARRDAPRLPGQPLSDPRHRPGRPVDGDQPRRSIRVAGRVGDGPEESRRTTCGGAFPRTIPPSKIRFRSTDSATMLIRTAKGAMIDLRYDISSPRPVPSTTYYSIQGTKASYDSRLGTQPSPEGGLWIDGRSQGPPVGAGRQVRQGIRAPACGPSRAARRRAPATAAATSSSSASSSRRRPRRTLAHRRLRRRGVELRDRAVRQVDRRRRPAAGNPRLHRREMGVAQGVRCGNLAAGSLYFNHGMWAVPWRRSPTRRRPGDGDGRFRP